ncbi:MAG: hypothetical protein ACRCX2_39110, partial [Paraclostridium sp.]
MVRPDRIRRIDPEGREHIDAIADILEGTSGNGPSTPLMDLVGEFQVIPTLRCKRDIDEWLTQIQNSIVSYRLFMHK